MSYHSALRISAESLHGNITNSLSRLPPRMNSFLRSICQNLLYTLQEYKEELNILQEAEHREIKGVSGLFHLDVEILQRL